MKAFATIWMEPETVIFTVCKDMRMSVSDTSKEGPQ